MSKTITISGHIYATQEVWDDKPNFHFFDFEPSSTSYVKIVGHTIAADIPDSLDIRPGLISALNAEKEKARAEFQKRITEIDRRIATYTAISNEVVA